MKREIPDNLKWVNDLKPEDEVYIESRYRFDKRKVDSTTKTTITVGGSIYKRGSLKCRSDSWSFETLIQITPETTARFVRYHRIERIKSLVLSMPRLEDPDNCTDSELAEAVRVLEVATTYIDAPNLTSKAG